MTNVALLVMASLFVASLVPSVLSEDPTTVSSLEASSDSAEDLSTSGEDKKAVGANRILNYGQSNSGGNGFGTYESILGGSYIPKEVHPSLPHQGQYPTYQQYIPPGQSHGYPTHQQYYNTGCKHYCPAFVPGTFYCCNKAPSYGGYYCPRLRQSCPASSRHNAPRPCIEDQGCYQGKKCCLDVCVGFHVCKTPEWR